MATPSPPNGGQPRHTLVCFHAHPDDESLLTGGVIARAAAEGRRVVIVVATLGEAATDDRLTGSLASRRAGELDAAAEALGAQKTVWLGYADSGMADRPSGAVGAFARADPAEAAERLARVLRSEACDVLTVYDRHGGYGHPDHVQVHRVGVLAADLAGVGVVLEATVDREALARVGRVISLVPSLGRRWARPALDRSYTPRSQLTHRVNVRPWLPSKRAALAAHASQASSRSGLRTLAVLLRLPEPLFARVLGIEWFVERGRTPGRPWSDDIFDSTRTTGTAGRTR